LKKGTHHEFSREVYDLYVMIIFLFQVDYIGIRRKLAAEGQELGETGM